MDEFLQLQDDHVRCAGGLFNALTFAKEVRRASFEGERGRDRGGPK
jgi:hypothetical protein